MTSNFTRRDSLDAGISGHGTAPVPDPTGTSPQPSRSAIDPQLLAEFNEGTRRAAEADRNQCHCGRTFADVTGLLRHGATHKRPPA